MFCYLQTTISCATILIAFKIKCVRVQRAPTFLEKIRKQKLRKEEINMTITVTGGTLPQAEINAYVAELKAANPDKYIKTVDFTIDGEYVDMKYTYDNVPFERIRRITGYLVGTIDRFNDAKRAEVQDRVKHSVDCGCSLEEIA